MMTLKTSEQIERMRKAGRVTAGALDAVARAAKPGVTTLELDAIAEDYIRSFGGIPSFKGFCGYPGSICASVNEEVVHGIPSHRRLKEGDIVGVDIGVLLDGWQGDVGAAIQEYAESHGCSVVRDLCGHGIGRNMHEDPEVPNFGKAGHGLRCTRGLVIAIEPMLNLGAHTVRTLKDGWTVVTADGSLSAHYENTVAITDGDPEILTLL